MAKRKTVVLAILAFLVLPSVSSAQSLPENLKSLPQDFKVLRVYMEREKLARLYQEGRYEEAAALAGEMEVLLQNVSEDGPKIDALEDIAKIYQVKARYAEAEKIYREVLKFRRGKPKDSAALANALSSLGLLCQQQGNFDEALGFTREALELRLRSLGPEHPDTAISYNNMAGLFRGMGWPEESEDYYERALAVWRAVYGERHIFVAKALNNLGILYQETGRFDGALGYFSEALEIQQALYGKDHPAVAKIRNNLGRLFLEQGRFEEAEGLYREALLAAQNSLGAGHPVTQQMRANLRFLYQSTGRFLEAALLITPVRAQASDPYIPVTPSK